MPHGSCHDARHGPVSLSWRGSPPPAGSWGVSRMHAGMAGMQVAFHSVDILTDDALRQGLKEFSKWPTYPQVCVFGGGGEVGAGHTLPLHCAHGSI